MDVLAERFRSATGSRHYLSGADAGAVNDYLRSIDYLDGDESVNDVSPAGEGNMNVALRVTTTRRSFILKQSRPWVAKFPQLEAPVERILIEQHFGEAIARHKALTARMPGVLLSDPTNYVMLLEDLGHAADLSTVYDDPAALSQDELTALLQFAAELHQLTPADFPANRKLRALNHAHIFDLPFRADSGFPLDELYPGLAAIAKPYHHDGALRRRVTELGETYLATGTRLIHGDFYPGSFLRAGGKVYVIDAEFGHPGRPEFDLGVLMAHLILAGAAEQRLRQLDTDYAKPGGFDAGLTRRFCYVEIMRRLIGIAQLPLSLSLDERAALLERARSGLLA